jgi:two-component system KDP operon response regulator KdpE
VTSTVLVVEDEPPIRRVLRAALDGQGYRVWEAACLSEGLAAFAARSPHAILLDLGLPDGEGFELIVRVRELSDVPILIISARGDERNQVRALDDGANDYVTKPFREAELMARLRAALRAKERKAQHSQVFHIGQLKLNVLERRAHLDDVEVELTPTEFNLLHAMARDAGRAMTHHQLLKAVWGNDHEDDVQYLRVFMRQLRQKLERDPGKPRLLVTLPGVGYRLKTPEPS